MAKRSLPYGYATEHRKEIEDIYINGGRRAVSDFLKCSYNGVGHILKYLNLYSSEVQDNRKSKILEGLRSPQHTNIFSSLDDTSLYILGFIVGDGCIIDRTEYEYKGYKRNLPYTLSIDNNDYDILVRIANSFGLSISRISKDLSGKGLSPTYKLWTNDYQTVQSLFSLGVAPRKSDNGCVINISRDCYAPFVRGLLDSDGCVRIIPKRSAKGKVRAFINIVGHPLYIKQIIDNTDFKWHYRETGKIAHIELYSYEEVKRFYFWVYKDSTICMDRKYKALYYCFERGEYYDKYKEYSHD